ncbi:MAG: hypothetical protein ACM3MK_03345 [Chitinophagales bacterium]
MNKMKMILLNAILIGGITFSAVTAFGDNQSTEASQTTNLKQNSVTVSSSDDELSYTTAANRNGSTDASGGCCANCGACSGKCVISK